MGLQASQLLCKGKVSVSWQSIMAETDMRQLFMFCNLICAKGHHEISLREFQTLTRFSSSAQVHLAGHQAGLAKSF